MAAVLAAVVTAGNAPLSYGAPAAVETDETMYVNLDVYGKAQKVNVVKSCSLNGVTDFTDYGNYLAVENMSTQERGKLSGSFRRIAGNAFTINVRWIRSRQRFRGILMCPISSTGFPQTGKSWPELPGWWKFT